MKKIATPWGTATSVEQISVPQRAGERRFATVVQLLEMANGERLVRFAYTTDGVSRRGPATLRAKDLERLRGLLQKTPALREALWPCVDSAPSSVSSIHGSSKPSSKTSHVSRPPSEGNTASPSCGNALR